MNNIKADIKADLTEKNITQVIIGGIILGTMKLAGEQMEKWWRKDQPVKRKRTTTYERNSGKFINQSEESYEGEIRTEEIERVVRKELSLETLEQRIRYKPWIKGKLHSTGQAIEYREYMNLMQMRDMEGNLIDKDGSKI